MKNPRVKIGGRREASVFAACEDLDSERGIQELLNIAVLDEEDGGRSRPQFPGTGKKSYEDKKEDDITLEDIEDMERDKAEEAEEKTKMNSAFIFIKPHACQ